MFVKLTTVRPSPNPDRLANLQVVPNMEAGMSNQHTTSPERSENDNTGDYDDDYDDYYQYNDEYDDDENENDDDTNVVVDKDRQKRLSLIADRSYEAILSEMFNSKFICSFNSFT